MAIFVITLEVPNTTTKIFICKTVKGHFTVLTCVSKIFARIKQKTLYEIIFFLTCVVKKRLKFEISNTVLY